MPTSRLTQLAVERIAPPKAGRVDYHDNLVVGFGLRVSATGKKSWFVYYRLRGVQRRYMLGSFQQVSSVADARELARAVLASVAQGQDPSASRAAAKAGVVPEPEPGAPVVHTVATLARDFIERYARPKNRSWRDTDGDLQLHVLPRWGDRPVTEITRRDVHNLLDGLIDAPKNAAGSKARPVGGPAAANHVRAAISRMFGWAVERDVITKSPVDGVKPPAPSKPRDRVLTADELCKVYSAAAEIGGVAGAYVRILILSVQRRSEVANMKWADLDLGKNVWTLVPDANKSQRLHIVPLSPELVEILTSLPREGIYVFSSTGGGRPLSGFSKLKAKMDGKVGFDDWRFHDLRRSAATGMAEHLKIADSIIELVLNHAATGVTRKHYNQYTYLAEKRQALDAWALHVQQLTQPISNAHLQTTDYTLVD